MGPDRRHLLRLAPEVGRLSTDRLVPEEALTSRRPSANQNPRLGRACCCRWARAPPMPPEVGLSFRWEDFLRPGRPWGAEVVLCPGHRRDDKASFGSIPKCLFPLTRPQKKGGNTQGMLSGGCVHHSINLLESIRRNRDWL